MPSTLPLAAPAVASTPTVERSRQPSTNRPTALLRGIQQASAGEDIFTAIRTAVIGELIDGDLAYVRDTDP